ncbi:MAG: glycosyltransferase family 4 protein [Anaerolineae bacterium]
MKIVMVGPFGLRPRGTMSVRALPLAKALVHRGHAVTLLLPPWQNPEDAGRAWQEDGVRVENVGLPAGVPGWFHLRLTARLTHRALTLRPDVIHAFKPKAYAGLVHWALHHRPGAPPVVVDTDDWEGPGGWNELRDYPLPLRRFFTWQERWGLRHAVAITVASRALQTLTWAQGNDPARVSYLPNASAWPHPPVTRLPEGRPTLLLYTRFFEFDVARLWRIVQGVRKAVPTVRLWVVGKGFFDEEQRLMTLGREAGWRVTEGIAAADDADLVYVGFVPVADQPAHFAQADVALYPFDDTLVNRTKCPVKLLDLLAAGLPVVGEAVGEIREIIADGGTGVLVPPGDNAAFVAAIVDLLNAPSRRRTLGEKAARVARERLTWDRRAVTAERVYQYAMRNA